jgi:hypothetical protein
MLAADGCGVGVSRCGTHLLGGDRPARPGVPAGRPGVDQHSKYTRDRAVNELDHPARVGTGSSANETGWRCHSASAHSEQTTRAAIGARPPEGRAGSLASRIFTRTSMKAVGDPAGTRSMWAMSFATRPCTITQSSSRIGSKTSAVHRPAPPRSDTRLTRDDATAQSKQPRPVRPWLDRPGDCRVLMRLRGGSRRRRRRSALVPVGRVQESHDGSYPQLIDPYYPCVVDNEHALTP